MEKQETNKREDNIKEDTKNKEQTNQEKSKTEQKLDAEQKIKDEQEKTNKSKEEEFFKKIEEIIKANEALTDENKKLKEQLAKVVNDFKEMQKDFDNFRSRAKEDILNAKKEGIFSVAGELLPALDAFKKAKKIITDKSSISGINLIEKNIYTGLERQNIKKISCKGQKFNPDFHDAVMLVEDKNFESGTIIEEVEAGFTYDDKVVKYSKVTVAK